MLQKVSEENCLFICHDLKLNTSWLLARFLVFWQFVIVLRGRNSTSTSGALLECKISGELMTEEAHLKQFENEPGQVVVTLVFKQFLSYYLGNYKLAAELSDKTQGYDVKYASGDSPAMRYLFFDCLTAFTMLQRKGRRLGNYKWHRRKSKIMKKLASAEKNGNVNVRHMILLLEAEEYSSRKKVIDLQTGRSKFDAAIAAATRAGFMQDSALAVERAGGHSVI